MALSDKEYQNLVKQLEQKKNKLGEAEYSNFLTRSSGQNTVEEIPQQGNFGVGVAKGLAKSVIGETSLGLGTLGRKIQGGISKGIGAVTGVKDFGMGSPGVFDQGSEQNTKAKTALERNTTGEKVGGFIGDVASFAVPGTAVTKATKGVNFLTRAAALGATDAATTVVKSGEVDKDAVDAAIIGAAFPIVGKGVSAAKSALLPSGKEAGGKVINSLIKPLLKDFSYGKNPGQAVAEAGITANNLDDLATKIRFARQDVGTELSQKVAGNKTIFDATKSLSSLEDAITEAQKSPRTNAAIISRLENLKADIMRVGEDGLPTRDLSKLSAEEVLTLKQEIGDLTRWTGNATDDELVNKALKSVYSDIKGQMDTAIPGIKELNEKYANLKSAEIATLYRDKIAARQNLISFSGTQAGVTTGLITAVASGGVTLPLLVGAGTAGIMEASKTPAFKTKLAAWLASASKEELQDAFTQAPWLRSTLQSVLFDVTE